MILVSRFFFFRGYVGLTLYPFIILRTNALKADPVLLNHEKIHLRQQREMLLIPFYIWYIIEWLVRYCHSLDAHVAYRNVSFEQEAYTNESNPGFLKGRAIFNFTKYL
jgi:hypothetical protein